MIWMVAVLPRMRVLGYQPTRPCLRILTLPEETIEPSPVALNGSACALDRGFRRDGWIVFASNAEVWGIPDSFEGKAFKVGGWWDCVPALDRTAVWLGVPVNPDPNARPDQTSPTRVVEYDGIAREQRRQLDLEPNLRLMAAVPQGLVVRSGGRGGPLLIPWGESTGRRFGARGDVRAVHGSVLATYEFGLGERVLSFIDLESGRAVVAGQPGGGRWGGLSGAFSPDGRTFAIGVETGRGLDAPGRLALVDVATGTTRLASGQFKSWMSTPVWSSDGGWLVVDAPFDKSMFACDVRAAAPAVIPIVHRRGRPGPIVDVTDLID